jgi:hypothetical protein
MPSPSGVGYEAIEPRLSSFRRAAEDGVFGFDLDLFGVEGDTGLFMRRLLLG